MSQDDCVYVNTPHDGHFDIIVCVFGHSSTIRRQRDVNFYDSVLREAVCVCTTLSSFSLLIVLNIFTKYHKLPEFTTACPLRETVSSSVCQREFFSPAYCA